VLESLKAGDQDRPFERYFHCELQLLRLLHTAEAAGKTTHPYIGVSKLSCYYCWKIISNGKNHAAKYSTKAGHHQISANCAFPLNIDRGYGYALEAIFHLQASMLHNILHEAVKIKEMYTTYTHCN
jgi:hypothetical protein